MRLIKRIFIILVIAGICILALGFYLPGFLSVDKPVETKNILVEAWISSYEIEQAVERFDPEPGALLLITGRIFPEADGPEWPAVDRGQDDHGKQGTWLFANSSLDFRIPGELQADLPDTVIIKVQAAGQEAAGRFAFFNLAVNRKSLGGRFTQKELSEYEFFWIRGGQPVNSLHIRFLNDLKMAGSDRNLLVKTVSVNGVLIPADRLNTRITREMNASTTGFDSQAGEVEAYIRAMGVSGDKIRSIEFIPPERNLTRAAAERFREYAIQNNLQAFNVVSSGIHCRRTWITYKKINRDIARAGILNFNADDRKTISEYSDQPYECHLAEESAAYLVNWLQLTFN